VLVPAGCCRRQAGVGRVFADVGPHGCLCCRERGNGLLRGAGESGNPGRLGLGLSRVVAGGDEPDDPACGVDPGGPSGRPGPVNEPRAVVNQDVAW
jgi:hypothetical protein